MTEPARHPHVRARPYAGWRLLAFLACALPASAAAADPGDIWRPPRQGDRWEIGATLGGGWIGETGPNLRMASWSARVAYRWRAPWMMELTSEPALIPCELGRCRPFAGVSAAGGFDGERGGIALRALVLKWEAVGEEQYFDVVQPYGIVEGRAGTVDGIHVRGRLGWGGHPDTAGRWLLGAGLQAPIPLGSAAARLRYRFDWAPADPSGWLRQEVSARVGRRGGGVFAVAAYEHWGDGAHVLRAGFEVFLHPAR